MFRHQGLDPFLWKSSLVHTTSTRTVCWRTLGCGHRVRQPLVHEKGVIVTVPFNFRLCDYIYIIYTYFIMISHELGILCITSQYSGMTEDYRTFEHCSLGICFHHPVLVAKMTVWKKWQFRSAGDRTHPVKQEDRCVILAVVISPFSWQNCVFRTFRNLSSKTKTSS